MFEVEVKHRVDDPAALAEQLRLWGVTLGPEERQVDRYFAHPARDFAQTDEALRLRSIGATNAITYKGPKVDASTKTRREIELPLASGAQSGEAWQALLEALGFRLVAQVTKQRRTGKVAWQGREATVACDTVDEVGSFVELELMASDEQLSTARECLTSLAAALDLGPSERRSYLELLLSARGTS